MLGRQVNTMRELDQVVSAGISKVAFDHLLTMLTDTGQGSDPLVALRNKIVPRATYQRSKQLNLQTSETAERLARLYALANSVFQDHQATRRFMSNPHSELEGRAPLGVALTEIGGRQVEEVIARGLHGLPA